MKFTQHYGFENKHAFLSGSKFHWVGYDEKKLKESYARHLGVKRGTEYHAFASEAIRLGIKLPKNKKTINQYVNDAIGFRMSTEVVLVYSENVFGTCDAISFRNDLLRIHDLKTGVSTPNMTQLEIYAALFFLEYDRSPKNTTVELRIYHQGVITWSNPDPEDLITLMQKIVVFDKIIKDLKEDVR